MGRFEGVPQRSLEERKKLFEIVKELKAKGLSYNEIIAQVEVEYGVRLSKSHVSGWLTGSHLPDGSVRKFEPTQTFELGYVTGTTLGDGTTSISGDHSYAIKLQVIDKDFAEEFGRCLGVILDRRPPHVRRFEARHSWRVQVSSLLLLRFLRNPLPEICKTVNQSESCPRGFLRGFFDSEGWVYDSVISAANTDKELIGTIREMLYRLQIYSSPPRLASKKGRVVTIRGQTYIANKDCYTFSIWPESKPLYLEKVGFAIGRKQSALLRAIDQLG